MEIIAPADLQSYQTFATPARAKTLAVVTNKSEFSELLPLTKKEKYLVLGLGSNVLFVNDWDGVVIVNNIREKTLISESDERVLVRFGAGEDWDKVVRWSLKQGWGGLENLSLIPGTVGAAPIQNIGAYGVEISELIVDVEAFNLTTGESRVFSRNDCEFGYRDSFFKHNREWLIAAVVLSLWKDSHGPLRLNYPDLKTAFPPENMPPSRTQVAEAVRTIRRKKLPYPPHTPNAGSFFKNPLVSKAVFTKLQKKFGEKSLVGHLVEDQYKLSAGQLISLCGASDFRENQAMVSPRHSLILINQGGASGMDIWNLAQKITQQVEQESGVVLVPEVRIIKNENNED